MNRSDFPIEGKSTPVTLGTEIELEVPEVWYGLSDPLDPTRPS